jgi:hypothetical protein
MNCEEAVYVELVMIMGKISEHYHIMVHACVRLTEVSHQIIAESKVKVVPVKAMKARVGSRGVVQLTLLLTNR